MGIKAVEGEGGLDLVVEVEVGAGVREEVEIAIGRLEVVLVDEGDVVRVIAAMEVEAGRDRDLGLGAGPRADLDRIVGAEAAL